MFYSFWHLDMGTSYDICYDSNNQACNKYHTSNINSWMCKLPQTPRDPFNKFKWHLLLKAKVAKPVTAKEKLPMNKM